MKVAATKIVIVEPGSRTLREDILVMEEPLQIIIIKDGISKDLSVTMRTPGNDLELVTGFLFTEGIIKSSSDIEKIWSCEQDENGNTVKVLLSADSDFDPSLLQRNFFTSSSCGICGKSSISQVLTHRTVMLNSDELKILPSVLMRLPEVLRAAQTVFKHTGGIHACGLFDIKGDLLLVREDVGRHNALDKLIGKYVMTAAVLLNGSILLLSGRASFELIQKSVAAGISVVASIGAPSSLAVKLAEETGITLVGFLKPDRLNIYSHPVRIAE